MYNLRYHIASLVAVFLALAVGLILGSIVVERGTIERQQDALVRSLQGDFVRINKENKDLNARLAQTEDFVSALVPRVTGQLLADKNILVMTNSGRTDGLSSAVDAIQAAGGHATVAMLGRQGLGLEDEKVASSVRDLLSSVDDGDALAQSVATSLSAEWVSAGPRPLTEALVTAHVLRIDNWPAERAVDGVVVLTSWGGKSDPFTLDLADALRARDVNVVGAQALQTSSGVAEAFAEEGFDAVNDLGSPRGAYSLSVLLAGLAHGSYGSGSSISGAFPAIATPH